MTKAQTPLFETPPVTGELWYDVQFEAMVEPSKPESMKWMYFSDMAPFKTLAIAKNWVKRMQARLRSADIPVPPMRYKPHFVPWEGDGVWRGTPCPKELLR